MKEIEVLVEVYEKMENIKKKFEKLGLLKFIEIDNNKE